MSSPGGRPMTGDITTVDTVAPTRGMVETREGAVSYLEAGTGPTALFVHGLATNAHLWRHVFAGLAPERRCIATDLPLHGHSPLRESQPLGLTAFAELIEAFCDELGLTGV